MKAWKGYYCCVPLCRSSSGQQFEQKRLGLRPVSFHSFPDLKTDRAKDWITKIRRDPGTYFTINKNIKICSLHFKPEDYLYSELLLPSAKPCLKPTAVPSVFPWTNTVSHHSTVTSKVAASSQQRCDILSPLIDDEVSSNIDELIPDHRFDNTVDDASTDATDTNILSSKVHALELKVKELENKLHQSESNAAQELFRLENIMQKEELVKFYTGFPDYATLIFMMGANGMVDVHSCSQLS